MKLFLFLLRASWRVVIVASLIGGLCGIASIGMVRAMSQAIEREDILATDLAWPFAGMCLAVLVTAVASSMLLIRLSQDAVRRLTLHLCERILQAPLRNLEEVGAARLLAALTEDVFVIAGALNGIPGLCTCIVTLGIGVVYLALLSPQLLAATLVFTAFAVTTYELAVLQARHQLRLGREVRDAVMKDQTNMIEGIKELKLHRPRRRVFFDDMLTADTAKLRNHLVMGYSIQTVAITWGRLMFFVAIGLVLFVAPHFFSVEAAVLSGYMLAILYLMSPLEGILAWLPFLIRAQISLRKIQELGLLIDSSAQAARPVGQANWRRLDLVGATHTYHREREGHDFVLGPIDLSLEPGDLLFIVGGNGSGKTTLAKLACGLYEPEAGEIRLDGQPITEENREAFRQLFTVVFAEVVIFDRLLGIEIPELDTRAKEYLEHLELDHKVTVSNGVFSTTELSKGQRKRLALLTAYLEDRPIYVFDEWAADQDPLFKRVFYKRILPDLKAAGKGVIVITHDDRYFSMADRIITLREGQMVDGYEDLMQPVAGRLRPAATQSHSP